MRRDGVFGWLPAMLAGLVVAMPVWSDERCVEQCDEKSDQCMQDAEGDEEKAKACDDAYSECLAACK
ncbi:MAG: hypothetical protein FJ191_12330 [Gammaproteobacteria bacterium]|nr:hypothetical protein [Gammaproteobacteria bacterium]